MKLTRFRDIPQITQAGSWECDFNIDSCWEQIQKWQTEKPGPLDLDPDFQRGHVWTTEQQIAWMEFILRGGKTSRVIYFNHAGWMRDWTGPFVVVDGKQRLEAVRRFLCNEIPVFGSFRREYADTLGVRHTLKFNMNDLRTRAEVLQWYCEFNSGGTPHTEEELDRVRGLLREELESTNAAR